MRVVDGPCRALYEHDVAVPFLVHQQISTTLIADDEMADENIFRDPFVTHLARLLAKDRSFVSEIGLDEFQPDQVVLGLEDVVGFILAMYNTAKSIFSTHKTLTLDEKFIRLIYSRFVLYPSFSQCPLTPDLQDALDPDALNYAEDCYEEIKRNANQSQCKWDDMPLSTKFFEICARVSIEEDVTDAIADDNPLLMMRMIGTRPVLAVAFKGVFSHIEWELGEYEESIHKEKELNGFPCEDLTEEEAAVYLYYYQGMTIKEIARILDMSESRVLQMHSSLVKRFKSKLREEIRASESRIMSLKDELKEDLTDVEHLGNLDKSTDKVIVEHPFFDDYIKAFQAFAVKQVDAQNRERLKKLNCSLFPPLQVSYRWEGWQIGIPRPPELFPKEWLDLRKKDIEIFLRDFFMRVEHGKLYCDYSFVIERFGEDLVKRRMIGKTGLQYNLERVYWTLNAKLRNWIRQNIENYHCSLVCELDEIVAKSDSWLRVAFFPTPGPCDIGAKKRKKLQKQMLHDFAPALEKSLIEQIWC